MNIHIGDTPQGKHINIDLDTLLRTRMLIQANSGKGKSWLLRRLAEQMFGKVQVIIIDLEGEFATLREKFGYVLVGKGGETPADPRSAEMVCHKLLELRASAVIDLYEMKPATRHEYVQKFLDAAIDAPKTLWHPCIFMLDEAHIFAPEKGAGESMASDAVISMATRGRKRGFCLIPATQRLGKLRKDVAAELLNVMVGGTFIDIDRKRAADVLGVYGKDQHEFFDEIKLLKRGAFYALGPAVSDERILVTVGQVETTHPEAGSARYSMEPPPLPEKIRALLPQLADLPKQAEEKARTEADLRAEVRRLESELRQAKKDQPVAVDPYEIHGLRAQVQEALQLVKTRDAFIKQRELIYLKFYTTVSEAAKSIAASTSEIGSIPQLDRAVESSRPAIQDPVVKRHTADRAGNGDGSIGNTGLRRMLIALAQRNGLSARQLGVRAALSSKSGTFSTYLSRGNSEGWIAGTRASIQITDLGLEVLGSYDPLPEGRELLNHWLAELGDSGAARILRVLCEHPTGLPADSVAELSSLSAGSGTFSTYLSRLRTLELITGERSCLKASEELFD